MTATALFEETAHGYRATGFARGPWDPAAAHGGPVAALVGHVFERHGDTEAFSISRVTLELLRPVPLGELRVDVVERRPGRKVQLLDLHMHADGKEVATARALRIRTKEIELPEVARASAAAAGPNPPEAGWAPDLFEVGWEAFHTHGVEIRMVEGNFNDPGPATAWVRLRVPVVADSEPSPLERALAAADFGNGISSLLSFEDYLFINPDLSVYLSRYPDGEWICLDSSSTITPQGSGVTQSALWDEQGPIGRATQGLFVDQR
ncbi:MAG: thioesterase family protein [Deltaproteobacteria bacterium]|nr:thioesterase family protein [Deltaproteobacteria bacterium]